MMKIVDKSNHSMNLEQKRKEFDTKKSDLYKYLKSNINRKIRESYHRSFSFWLLHGP